MKMCSAIEALISGNRYTRVTESGIITSELKRVQNVFKYKINLNHNKIEILRYTYQFFYI